MFPFFSPTPEPARTKTKAEPVRSREARVPRRARTRSDDLVHAADMQARLRRAAKKAFWMMGED